MIELRGVRKRFGKQIVLDGVDFNVQEGETVALLGPSGTGKSVLLKHIIGLIHPDQGTIIVDDKDVGRLKRDELSELRSHIGYVFQNGALFDSDDVFENVRLGITDDRKYRDLDYARTRVAECIKLVNLPPETVDKFPAQLSGGMRKRVGIARAIAGNPKYLLYDEPTTGLDPVTSAVIDELMIRMRDRLGVTSIVITHDMRSAYRVGTRIAMLFDGRVRSVGTVDEIQHTTDPVVRQFIEGRADIDDPRAA